MIEAGPSESTASIAESLNHWQEDADLAGIRAINALAALPESERTAWRIFWAEVARLQAKIRVADATKKSPISPRRAFDHEPCRASRIVRSLADRIARHLVD